MLYRLACQLARYLYNTLESSLGKAHSPYGKLLVNLSLGIKYDIQSITHLLPLIMRRKKKKKEKRKIEKKGKGINKIYQSLCNNKTLMTGHVHTSCSSLQHTRSSPSKLFIEKSRLFFCVVFCGFLFFWIGLSRQHQVIYETKKRNRKKKSLYNPSHARSFVPIWKK